MARDPEAKVKRIMSQLFAPPRKKREEPQGHDEPHGQGELRRHTEVKDHHELKDAAPKRGKPRTKSEKHAGPKGGRNKGRRDAPSRVKSGR